MDNAKKKTYLDIVYGMTGWLLEDQGYTVKDVIEEPMTLDTVFHVTVESDRFKTRFGQEIEQYLRFYFYERENEIAVDVLTFISEKAFESVYPKYSSIYRMFNNAGIRKYFSEEELRLTMAALGVI